MRPSAKRRSTNTPGNEDLGSLRKDSLKIRILAADLLLHPINDSTSDELTMMS